MNPGPDAVALPSADTLTSAGTPAGLPWLVADVGGTNARFGWVSHPDRGVEHVRKLPVADHAGPDGAAEAYLQGLAPMLGPVAPRKAAFAFATAIDGDQVDLTNSHWRFSRAALQRKLGLDTLLVLNDFEALALSLPRLGSHQLRGSGAMARPQGMLAVIGPGTGLGVAGVVQSAQGWQALPGEGGHATLSAADDFESDLLRWVRGSHEHVSAERLLSGIGLPLLHQAVAAVSGTPAEALTAEQVVHRGVDASCALCRRTLEVFCALLGGFAGNVALTLGARGGVYIGGGIVPRLGDLFFASQFRERFEAKGRFRGYLQAIPTVLITDTLAALTGSALAIEQERPGPSA